MVYIAPKFGGDNQGAYILSGNNIAWRSLKLVWSPHKVDTSDSFGPGKVPAEKKFPVTYELSFAFWTVWYFARKCRVFL